MTLRNLLPSLFLAFYLPASAHDMPIHYDHVSLTASASQEVPQDELMITLYAVSEADDAKTTSDEVSNRIMKALSILNTEKDITTKTGGFNTRPVYRKQKITGWRTRQTIEIKSINVAIVSQLLARLQDHVLIESMRYEVSKQTRRQAENQLIEEAMNNFRYRARLVTTSLQRQKYRLVDLNISTNQQRPHFAQARSMAMMADSVSAPPIQAGKQRIQVTINGKIEVQLNNK